MRPLVLGRCPNGHDLVSPGIEFGRQPLDRPALPGRVPALEDDDRRDLLAVERALQLRDPALKLFQPSPVLFLGNAYGKVGLRAQGAELAVIPSQAIHGGLGPPLPQGEAALHHLDRGGEDLDGGEPLVLGLHDRPGRMLAVRGLEHLLDERQHPIVLFE